MAKFLDQDGLSHLLSKLDGRYATIDSVDSSLQTINSSINTITTNINSLQNFCDYKSQSYTQYGIGGATPENNINTEKSNFSIRELKLSGVSLPTTLNYNLKIGPAVQTAPANNSNTTNTPFGPGLLMIKFTGSLWEGKKVVIKCADTKGAMGSYGRCAFVADYITLTGGSTVLNYWENIQASQITVTGINDNISSTNNIYESMLLCHMFGYPGVTYVRVTPVNCKVQYPLILESN